VYQRRRGVKSDNIGASDNILIGESNERNGRTAESYLLTIQNGLVQQTVQIVASSLV
jgi:hypothetical protein